MFVSKQVKALTIVASENSTLHKQAVLPRFTEYLMHVLNRFYQAVFPSPANTDWERGFHYRIERALLLLCLNCSASVWGEKLLETSKKKMLKNLEKSFNVI